MSVCEQGRRQVGVGIVMTSGKPTWCNGSTLAWDARDVRLSPVLGTVFPSFITPTTIIYIRQRIHPCHRMGEEQHYIKSEETVGK